MLSTKETQAVLSTLRLFYHFDKHEGVLSTLPNLHPWKVFHWFTILANCLGKNIVSIRCYKKVRQLTLENGEDTATITKLDCDIIGLASYPGNTCCVCLHAGSNCFSCSLCGISSYCSTRCQQVDRNAHHLDLCPQLVGWSPIIFPDV